MKAVLALNFFIFAAIQLGLLLGILHYLRGSNRSKPSWYWIAALVINVAGLGSFGFGILFTDDIQSPPVIFTFANTLFFMGALCQALFFLSLNHKISKRLIWVMSIITILYGLIFEYLRQHWNFEGRTIFAVSTYAFILVWQIREVRLINQKLGLQQLRYFQYAAIGEGFFLIPRLITLFASNLPIHTLDQLPQLLIVFTFAQILMNTLSFIAIWGYWSEKLALDSLQTESEKDLYKKLLEERETLISSLLKVNKTSTTGALSASIAHEINQPLGAIQINSEYLQKKVQEEEVDRQLIVRLAEDIARDNMRAARIIRTLKSIFIERYTGEINQAPLMEVVDSVLVLSKSELLEKGIATELSIPAQFMIPMSFGEAQQLFLNLVNNAIQALDTNLQSPKVIRIIAQDGPNQIMIRVEDSGPGVPIEQQPSLFDLFSGTKREGMGLGLWLCSYIIGRHGGRIRYDAQMASGAAFEITFPKTE